MLNVVIQIDTTIMFNMQIYLDSVFQLFGTIIVVGITTPYTLVAFIPIAMLFAFLQQVFLYIPSYTSLFLIFQSNISFPLKNYINNA